MRKIVNFLTADSMSIIEIWYILAVASYSDELGWWTVPLLLIGVFATGFFQAMLRRSVGLD